MIHYPIKPPLHRIKVHIVDLSRVAAIYWDGDDEAPSDLAKRLHDATWSDSYPSVSVWFNGGSTEHAGRANLSISDVKPDEYRELLAAWEAAR